MDSATNEKCKLFEYEFWIHYRCQIIVLIEQHASSNAKPYQIVGLIEWHGSSNVNPYWIIWIVEYLTFFVLKLQFITKKNNIFFEYSHTAKSP